MTKDKLIALFAKPLIREIQLPESIENQCCDFGETEF